jgi:hypothetical protein
VPITDGSRGDFYAVVQIEGRLTISRYDEAQGMTPDEFVKAYRTYFGLGGSRVTRFDEPSESGCRLFMADSDGSDELCVSGIFVPDGVSERDARRELADRFRIGVSNFDLAMRSAAEVST